MEKLGINLPYFLSQLINFGLIAVLLTVLLYRPILNMLQQRKERIARSMADVDEARSAAARAQLEYDRTIAEAQRKAQEIIAQAAQAGDKVRVEIEADARREADAIRQKARDEATQEKSRVMADVQGQIASLSMLATERVLGQTVDAPTQRKLIDDFLAELGK